MVQYVRTHTQGTFVPVRTVGTAQCVKEVINHYSRFSSTTIGLAKDHWRGFCVRNSHMVHIVYWLMTDLKWCIHLSRSLFYICHKHCTNSCVICNFCNRYNTTKKKCEFLRVLDQIYFDEPRYNICVYYLSRRRKIGLRNTLIPTNTLLFPPMKPEETIDLHPRLFVWEHVKIE